MPSLRDLQAAFVGALFDADDAGAGDFVLAGGMAAQARIRIYRNNILHNYCAALRDVYPVVERLVGEDFFAFAARRYIPGHPSQHGNLHRFGAGFGAFLDAFDPAAGVPYLGDVARLEWLMHESFHAADHRGMERGRLAALAQDGIPALRLLLHPACRLIDSRFPVHRIWQANQPDAPQQTLELGSGGARLLIRRSGHAVELQEIEAAEHAMLSALLRGAPLHEALAATLAAMEQFDVASFLARRVADATVVDWAPAAA